MIREATAEDFHAVMRLYCQLHVDDPVLEERAARKVFDEILSASTVHLMVLEHEEAVVATAYLNVIPNLTRSASPYAVIENVVVDENLRATGLGKQLMAATLDAAWNAGCYKAMLMTGSRRPSTLGFYRTCGFSPDEKSAFVAHP
jgi:N-acetylglutamate synthase-like GNAT family acetyltransferase